MLPIFNGRAWRFARRYPVLLVVLAGGALAASLSAVRSFAGVTYQPLVAVLGYKTALVLAVANAVSGLTLLFVAHMVTAVYVRAGAANSNVRFSFPAVWAAATALYTALGIEHVLEAISCFYALPWTLVVASYLCAFAAMWFANVFWLQRAERIKYLGAMGRAEQRSKDA